MATGTATSLILKRRTNKSFSIKIDHQMYLKLIINIFLKANYEKCFWIFENSLAQRHFTSISLAYHTSFQIQVQNFWKFHVLVSLIYYIRDHQLQFIKFLWNSFSNVNSHKVLVRKYEYENMNMKIWLSIILASFNLVQCWFRHLYAIYYIMITKIHPNLNKTR